MPKIVPKDREKLTIEEVAEAYRQRSKEIKARLAEFASVRQKASDSRIWEEMVFCFFTGGCSAKMGLKSVEAVRHLLKKGDYEQLRSALKGVHRYPNARSRYIVESREFLKKYCGLRLREVLENFNCDLERRDWLVKEKGIKGLGYKEASHFLRNVGFRGYAILDKHVLRCLASLKIIEEPKPPNTRSRYLTVENKLKKFAEKIEIDFDELDLVLWSIKTGQILK
jgi:N-glycosylase/DNA lyase